MMRRTSHRGVQWRCRTRPRPRQTSRRPSGYGRSAARQSTSVRPNRRSSHSPAIPVGVAALHAFDGFGQLRPVGACAGLVELLMYGVNMVIIRRGPCRDSVALASGTVETIAAVREPAKRAHRRQVRAMCSSTPHHRPQPRQRGGGLHALGPPQQDLERSLHGVVGVGRAQRVPAGQADEPGAGVAQAVQRRDGGRGHATQSRMRLISPPRTSAWPGRGGTRRPLRA